MSLLSHKHLQDEEAAYAWVEARLWPNGAVCPHCSETERVSKMKGKATRVGLYKCYKCRKQFNVKIGTIFEKSHIPMRLWLQAIYLIASSKKGISSNQLHRTLGLTLKSAWFMSHRIREAMRTGGLNPLGGNGGSGIVEIDETFIGRKKGGQARRAYHHKNAVLSLVERGGEVRSFHVDKVKMATVTPIIRKNVAKEARVMTDEGNQYKGLHWDFAEHQAVNHSAKEYARGDAHTNTIENYYSIFKRGMKGIYQHCDERHLHRYVAEFDFRYNNRIKLGVDDQARADNLLKGVVGKRLTYQTANKEVRKDA